MDPTAYYAKEFTVAEYECNVDGIMTPGAILRQAQQIATEQCEVFGGGTQVLAEKNCAFLLARMAMELRAPVRAGQRITLATMPSAQQGASFHRCTTLCDAQGARLCAVDSRWALVNIRERHIYRRQPEDFPLHFASPPAFELPMKFQRAAEAQVRAVERANYTRCDVNRHLNNTRYADIVMDYLPLARHETKTPARLVIFYHNEIPLGTAFSLWGGETQPDEFYFCGEDEASGKKYFEASVQLAEKQAGPQ